MKVMVQVEHYRSGHGWAPTSEPVEMESTDVKVWLPPGRVRVRFTSPDGEEKVTDTVMNRKPRTVRLSGKDE